MALSVSSGPSLLQVAFGQVLEVSYVINSTSPLTGTTITVFPELFGPTNVAPAYFPNTGRFVLVYPAAGTVQMVWQGLAQYENLELFIEHVSTTVFNLHFSFIVGRDRVDVNQEIAPNSLLDGPDNQFSIYNTARYLNLFIYEPTTNGRVATGTPITGVLPQIRGRDRFNYSFTSGPTMMVVSRPKVGEDFTVKFSLFRSGLDLDYQVVIFNRGFCASGVSSDTLEEHLDLEGIDSNLGALPGLTAANLTASAMVFDAGAGLYRGEFTIDSNWLIQGCTQGILIIVTDGANRNYSYSFDIVTQTDSLPTPDVDVFGAIQGDTIYNTNCFTNVPQCAVVTFTSVMDVDSYNISASSLGIPGNYASNIITINAYALDHEPLRDEDLSGFQSLPVKTVPLAAGGAYVIYQFPEDAAGITFIVFDYVFKDHSIRVPIKALHPTLSKFDSVSFLDSDDNLLNPVCADYGNGIKALLEFTDPITDANAFDWNNVKIYSDGVDFSDAIIGSTLTDDSVEIELDVDMVDPQQCFCLAASRLPLDDEAVGACIDNTFFLTQTTEGVDRFSINITFSSGPGFTADPSNYLVVRSAGEVIATFVIVDDFVGAGHTYYFEYPFEGLNEFTYELFTYAEAGCDYYGVLTLATSDVIFDVGTGFMVISS